MKSALVIAGLLLVTPARSQDISGSDEPFEPAALLLPSPTGLSERPYWRRNIFGRVSTDQKFLFTIWWPEEFRRGSFAAPLAGGVLMAALASPGGSEGPDVGIEQAMGRIKAVSASRALTRAGNVIPVSIGLGTTYLVSRWRGHDKLAEATSLSFEALVDAQIWSGALKKATARERPTAGGRGDFFRYHPMAGREADSFPSGHAAAAFAVATIFSRQYADRRWVPLVAYGTAGMIGASRVVLERHFPSDVVVGAILGNTMARMVLLRGERARGFQSSLQPLIDPATGSFGLVYRRTIDAQRVKSSLMI